MHQRVVGAGKKTVIDEKILLERQLRIAALQIARAITVDAVAQRQVLCTSRRPDGIGLDEPQLVDGTHQGGRLEQRARNGVATQMAQGNGHAANIPNRRGQDGNRVSG